MSEHQRLFIASTMNGDAATSMVELTRSLRQQWQNTPFSTTVRWIPVEHWHLTWAFLGDTPTEKISVIAESLNRILRQQPSMLTHWEHLSWWPSPKRAQILVGQLAPTPALLTTAQAIREISSQLFPPTSEKNKKSRSFKPHITLARIKTSHSRNMPSSSHRSEPKPAAQTQQKAPFLPPIPLTFPSWQIENITLFQSQLCATGATHSALYTVPLILGQ